jgi:hypothetical protein
MTTIAGGNDVNAANNVVVSYFPLLLFLIKRKKEIAKEQIGFYRQNK